MATGNVRRVNTRVKRSGILALVAMLELLLLSVSLTFSWFERALDPYLKDIEINTAPALLSTFMVGPTDGDTDPVDLRFYFDKGSIAKFSPVSLDADKLTFVSREGVPMSTSEMHAALLTFDFRVTSVGEDCDFWFEKLILRVNGESALAFDLKNETREPIVPEGDLATEVETTEQLEQEPTTECDELEQDQNSESVPTLGDVDSDDAEVEGTPAGVENTIVNEFTEQQPATTTDEAEESDEDKSEAREISSTAGAFKICFFDGQNAPTILSFADVWSYAAGGVNKLFSCEANLETSITCMIWLDATDDDLINSLQGSSVEIEMLLSSDWAVTNVVRFTDETALLDEQYPEILSNDYAVELVHTASGSIYPAFYDEENNAWFAEIPQAINEYTVRYRADVEGHDVFATWDIINGKYAQNYALYDEGMYLTLES